MNIDYKLEPITGKNVAAYFQDLDFNCYGKLLYHFKNITFAPDLLLVLGFITIFEVIY